MPRRPIPLPCFARLTEFRKIGTDPIFLKWEKWGLSLFFLLAGCAGAPPDAPAPGVSYFGLLGDTPYSEDQARRLDGLIDEMNAQPLAFVVHLGDIGTSVQACRDDWLAQRQAQFGRIRRPFALLPGDNEWSDCHQRGLDPLERLARWRTLFCGRETIPGLERQAGEYCEHVRWRAGDALFVALNIPGNNNNLRQPAEQAARMRAAMQWLDEALALSPARLFILMQANPFVARQGYAALVQKLEAIGRERPGRVVLLHGDTHLYKDDEPLPGLRRIEVWGAPWVSWLRGALVGGELRVDGVAHH